MRILNILSAVIFGVFVTPAHAVLDGGGPSGTNFSYDVNTATCVCSGVLEGADCQAMLKNCKNCTAACHDDPRRECVCGMRTEVPKLRPEKVPNAPVKQQ